MVLFPIISFIAGGWMMGLASAPYDPYWARRHPRRAAWMSLAGPGANFSLALIAAAAIHVGIWIGVFRPPDSASFTRIVEAAKPGGMDGAATLLSILFSLNLLLGCFNLLPVPPLDGFGAVGVLLSETAGQRLQELGAQVGAYSMIGLLVAWKVFDPIFDPIFTMALRALYPGSGYG